MCVIYIIYLFKNRKSILNVDNKTFKKVVNTNLTCISSIIIVNVFNCKRKISHTGLTVWIQIPGVKKNSGYVSTTLLLGRYVELLFFIL